MIKRKVREVDFSKEGSHISLVSTPANQQEEVTIMKQKKEDLKKAADEVFISTSMQSFLSAFFHMWEDDAAELAEILGYEPQEWTYDLIGEDTQVTLLKSLDPETKISQDLYTKIEKMGVEFTQLIKKDEEMKKTKEELKKEAEVTLQKSIDEAVKVALDKADAEKADLLKAKDTEIADLKKAEDIRVMTGYIELCKGYSFVEDADVLAETLFKCKEIKGFDLILDTLEKARTAVAGDLEGEKGTDQEKELKKEDKTPDHLTKTAELIKERHGKKENK